MSSTRSTRHQFALIDGRRVFYREAGSPDAPALVLLHGFPSSSHMFRDLIRLLAGDFHVIAPDYLGFGHSDAPAVTEFDYTFDNLTAVVAALLDQLGIHSSILYMQDYGGPIGLRLAANDPARVAGLIVQNANAYLEGVGQPLLDIFLPFWNAWTDETERAARGFLAAETTKFLYTTGARAPDALNPDAWAFDQAGLDRPGNDHVQLALFKDYATNLPWFEKWHAYFVQHAPKTLIVWGVNDPLFVRAGAEAYLRDLPDAEVHFLDGGHFALEEYAPEIANHVVRVFGRR
ncbi:MAG TPA: alpha/beta hydrolase [Gemmatimonadaceae bacterium]|nr:alpha/beta hydrolase [Gemmatimonadaceae bacterium]